MPSFDEAETPPPLPAPGLGITPASRARAEGALRTLAREAIQVGRIPAGLAQGIWGGPGTGDICPVCEKLVRPDELELELEYAEGGRHLHVRCYAAWDFARRNTSV